MRVCCARVMAMNEAYKGPDHDPEGSRLSPTSRRRTRSGRDHAGGASTRAPTDGEYSPSRLAIIPFTLLCGAKAGHQTYLRENDLRGGT